MRSRYYSPNREEVLKSSRVGRPTGIRLNAFKQAAQAAAREGKKPKMVI